MCENSRTSKPWYKSKTMWVNLASIVGGLTPLVMNFEGLISPMAYAVAITVLATLNVVLRVITTEPIDVVKS